MDICQYGGNSVMTSLQCADSTVDVTKDICPMTFVRTRLALDRIKPGQTLLVRMKGEEPLRLSLIHI